MAMVAPPLRLRADVQHDLPRLLPRRTSGSEYMTLFSLPGEDPPPRMSVPPKAAVFARYRPRTRQLCFDCVADIHARGQAVAPLPASVRWRALIGSANYLLCERHKVHRQENPS